MMPKSLTHHETASSRRAHNDEGWNPDWVELVFAAWLKCSEAKCGEMVAVSGLGGYEPEYDPEDGSYTFQERFYPQYVCPMPDVIELPAKCPSEVGSELRGAFQLLFIDPGAAANRVRVALECLMDHVGVQTRRKDSKGKFTNLSLHQRLELFRKAQPAIADQLMAVKWLGNSGSHHGQSTRGDLLDAFEIVENALAEVIEGRSEKAAALARRLSKKHAPKRRKR